MTSLQSNRAFTRPTAPRNGGLIESNSHSVISLPNDLARKPQPIIWYDQCERRCNRDEIDGFGKLDRRARRGKVAHRAWVFVATVLGDGWLIDSVTWGNPSVDHTGVRMLV